MFEIILASSLALSLNVGQGTELPDLDLENNSDAIAHDIISEQQYLASETIHASHHGRHKFGQRYYNQRYYNRGRNNRIHRDANQRRQRLDRGDYQSDYRREADRARESHRNRNNGTRNIRIDFGGNRDHRRDRPREEYYRRYR